jgi:alanine racemase
MSYTVKELAKMLGIAPPSEAAEMLIKDLVFDSRRVINPATSLFVAIRGQRDGHLFIDDAWKAGIRVFLVEKSRDLPKLEGAVYLKTEDSLRGLQAIAASHRGNFELPVIGISGSNGKTTVKEWLHHLLGKEFNIVRSPKSFNSQIGVALSVWQIEKSHHLGIFEAGISRPGEMSALKQMIRPRIGIFTGIGAAHDEGFRGREEKIREKLLLFENCHTLVFPADLPDLKETVLQWASGRTIRLFGWSKKETGGKWHHISVSQIKNNTELRFKGISYTIPYTDEGSIDNACSCILSLEALSLSPEKHRHKFTDLPDIEMRLQLKKGILNSQLINDSYSADLTSLEIALDFLAKQAGKNKKAVILSELKDTGRSEEKLNREIKALLEARQISRLILVGQSYYLHQPQLAAHTSYFEDTAQLLREIDWKQFQDSIVLLKGSRSFTFEKIARRLEQQSHETVLEIDLNALESNLKYFRSCVSSPTKIMAMVKAHGYGSGTHEIAYQLQSSGIDYLAVAYADEGMELRKKGVSVPVMVMNPERENLVEMLDYGLEPDIYNFNMLEQLLHTMENAGITEAGIHLEFDTGMHRLGFSGKDVPELIRQLNRQKGLRVKSVFSHLAASDDPAYDAFTKRQIADFKEIRQAFGALSGSIPLFHILNTAGILRFPEAQMDMVRTGIGLYGVNPLTVQEQYLQPVATLRAGISQIRELAAGETVGYSGKGRLERDSRIAVITIGYADGFRRLLGNGRGHVWVNGKLAPVVGNVCMDMTMIDVSGIECQEGEAVEIFGNHRKIEDLALECETIPYEIIAGIAGRVKRIYWHE